MQYLASFTIALLTSVVYFTVFWFLTTKFKKLWLADVAWATGFFVVYLISYLINKSGGIVQNLILLMLLFWGIRLASYLIIRNYNKEDFRYEKLKNKFGSKWLNRSYLSVFVIQAIILVVVNSAAIIATVNFKSESITTLNYIAAVLWLIGFLIESIADLQLYKFKQTTPDSEKVMKKGLWKYTRHPNYLGEIIMWSSILILIIPSRYWYIGIISPIVITFFLLKFTGINLVENRRKESLEYQEYKSITPKIFPNFKQILKDLPL